MRPFTHLSSLKIWDYYLTEDLAHGSPFDFEVTACDLKTEEEQEMIDGPSTTSARKVINGCYDDVTLTEPAVCKFLLQVSSLVINNNSYHFIAKFVYIYQLT